jgi:5-methylthioadenosine/S-adenosylhomocysteine deaminase
MPPKPTFVLHGRIVTMTKKEDVINSGYVAIKDGRIAAIADSVNNLPAEFQNKTIIETEGTIYPGLIDLHNHFVYNVLPLWVVPKKYDNRSQWPAHAEYKSGVSKPIKQALAKYSITAKALVRYVETKALIGGTTTGQGMRTQVKGGSKIFEGAMRNVEEPGDPQLKPASSMVPDLVTSGATAQERIDRFRKTLDKPELGAYFYHLSEGVDSRARQHFLNLKDNDLIAEKLVGIHSLGLKKADLADLAAKGAKVVWSPFSNQLLYGKTIELKDLKASGVLFSLGCDWTPSGSKNLLQELKVAYHTNEVQQNVFTTFELVQMVTSMAAAVTGWEEHIGTIEKNKLADLLIIKGASGDPFMQLIEATEKQVELVVVDGIARYGNNSFMKKLNPAATLEVIETAGIKKALYLFCENSGINDVSFIGATEVLKDAMQDLPGFVKRMEEEEAGLMALGLEPEQEFTIELDNEFSIEADMLQEYEQDNTAALLADVPMAESVELDTAIVEGKEYWDRIINQKNISQELIGWLKDCYKQP